MRPTYGAARTRSICVGEVKHANRVHTVRTIQLSTTKNRTYNVIVPKNKSQKNADPNIGEFYPLLCRISGPTVPISKFMQIFTGQSR